MLCKCSGKYIDIYFILKITFFFFWGGGGELSKPSGTDGWDMVFTECLFSLLPSICHPHRYGHLFHQLCSGGSAGRVTH